MEPKKVGHLACRRKGNILWPWQERYNNVWEKAHQTIVRSSVSSFPVDFPEKVFVKRYKKRDGLADNRGFSPKSL